MKQYKLSLFIFRRDLRLVDNTALNKALTVSQAVIPLFIVDPRQYKPHPYRSDYGLQFLIESLEDLRQQFKSNQSTLYVANGHAHDVIKQLLIEYPIEAIFVNNDYTPFSIARDLVIKEITVQLKRDFYAMGDALLHEPNEIAKPDGSGPYTVYTPFYKRSQTFPVRPVANLTGKHFYTKPIKGLLNHLPDEFVKQSLLKGLIKGGRSEALRIVANFKAFKNYDNDRNMPALDATTHLSAHHKFGTVSIREVYHALVKLFGAEHTLIRELYWRDFFTHIAYHFPHVFGEAFYREYDKIQWRNSPKDFDRWCEGKTGFPIVDAGMRELNATGFMHNRVRMIVGSFLVKDLQLDWRLGERYFATKLIDYDPCVNNGSWQWVASTGCDKQPYYRIFNPWLQQQKFDPDAVYIKKWVPELRAIPASVIHEWSNGADLFNAPDYFPPMLDHALAKEQTLKMYQAISKRQE